MGHTHTGLLKMKLWYNYLLQKFNYASSLSFQKYKATGVVTEEVWLTLVKTVLQEKMTYLYKNKGSEMVPTISAQETLVVRRFPCAEAEFKQFHEEIYVGDVLVLRDPSDPSNYLVRRLAALKGHEMVSTIEEDEPFVIEDGQCWVLSDNQDLKPEERKDSRTYGPISMTSILGRVVYRYRPTAKDRGFVGNNKLSIMRDLPLFFVEVPTFELQRWVKSSSKDVEKVKVKGYLALGGLRAA